MTELDVVKEKIAYMKLWLGILVVTEISLLGWLVSNYEKAKLLFVISALIAIIALSGVILVLHKRIERDIARLGEL